MSMRSLSRRIPIQGRGYDLAVQACGPLACNMFSLVCEATGDAVVVDPSTHDQSELEGLVQHLDSKNANVQHIFLTHGHADHVSGVRHVLDAWPDAKLHLHPLEEENYQMAHEQGKYFGLRVPQNLPEPTDILADGDILKVGESIELHVVHTPGHAPGHVAFVDKRPSSTSTSTDTTKNNEEKSNNGAVVIGGDLLFRGSVGRTDFFNSSVEDLFVSIRRLYDELDDDSIILSGHTTPTFLKEERESNPFVHLALERPAEWYQEGRQRHKWK